jgi:hypothetical protein
LLTQQNMQNANNPAGLRRPTGLSTQLLVS